MLALSMESLPIPGAAGVMEGAFVLFYAGVFGENLVLPAMLLTRGLNYYFWLILGGLVSAGSLKLPQRRRALEARVSQYPQPKKEKGLLGCPAASWTPGKKTS